MNSIISCSSSDHASDVQCSTSSLPPTGDFDSMKVLLLKHSPGFQDVLAGISFALDGSTLRI